MTTIKAPLDGKEHEFTVLGSGIPACYTSPPTHVINSVGEIHPLGAQSTIRGNWMYLRLVRPRHTFGGVVYEEVGVQRVQLGEPFLWDSGGFGGVWPVQSKSYISKMVLRPVELESKKETL